jgi:hypothetical protein
MEIQNSSVLMDQSLNFFVYPEDLKYRAHKILQADLHSLLTLRKDFFKIRASLLVYSKIPTMFPVICTQ